jgi:hypothetical protein
VKCVEEKWFSSSRWRDDEKALNSLLAKVRISEVAVAGLDLVFTVKVLQRRLSDVHAAGNNYRKIQFQIENTIKS